MRLAQSVVAYCPLLVPSTLCLPAAHGCRYLSCKPGSLTCKFVLMQFLLCLRLYNLSSCTDNNITLAQVADLHLAINCMLLLSQKLHLIASCQVACLDFLFSRRQP